MVRLNLGSGPHYAEGWVNVDSNVWPTFRSPDVIGSVLDLPLFFEARSVDRFYVGHLLEHLPWPLLESFWGSVRAVAAPRAEVAVVGPCLWKAIGTRQPPSILEAIVPRPWEEDGSGGGHAWCPTTEATQAAIELGGLQQLHEVSVQNVREPEWPNPEPEALWQCAFLAIVP